MPFLLSEIKRTEFRSIQRESRFFVCFLQPFSFNIRPVCRLLPRRRIGKAVK